MGVKSTILISMQNALSLIYPNAVISIASNKPEPIPMMNGMSFAIPLPLTDASTIITKVNRPTRMYQRL